MRANLRTTEEMVRMARETVDIGASTLVELDEQGRKIERSARTLDAVDGNVHESKLLMNRIESIFGFLRNKFVRKAPTSGLGSRVHLHAPPATGRAAATLAPRGEAAIAASSAAGSLDEIRLAQDRNLDMLADEVARLKALAGTIGQVTEEHNDALTDLTIRVERTDANLRTLTKRVVRAT